MAIRTRADQFDAFTEINTREIMNTSRMVSMLTGFVVQPNKAIVGANAFAHEAGIHQHGMIQDRETYEIMKPEDVGLTESVFTLGPRSGRHGLRKRLEDLGYEVPAEQMDGIYERFVAVADKKRQVYDGDLHFIMREATTGEVPEIFHLEKMSTITETGEPPRAEITLRREGELHTEEASGNGPVNSIYTAISSLTGVDVELYDYTIRSVTRGRDALGEVTVRVKSGEEQATGKAASVDVLEASALAFLNAINTLLMRSQARERRGDQPDEHTP